jgi:hypothetical protein
MYAADREHVRLVEVRDRLVVLTLPVLDHEPACHVEGVYRQGPAPSISSGVADEPIKAVLTARGFADDRVAQVEDVSLVRVRACPASAHHPLGAFRDVHLARASKPVLRVAVESPALDKLLGYARVE